MSPLIAFSSGVGDLVLDGGCLFLVERALAPLPQPADRAVMRDREYPGIHRRPAFEPRGLAPDFHHGLVEDVFHHLALPHQLHQIAEERPLQAAVELRKALRSPAATRCNSATSAEPSPLFPASRPSSSSLSPEPAVRFRKMAALPDFCHKRLKSRLGCGAAGAPVAVRRPQARES